jgi:signal transduction histidine kinase/ActR/RegA family two-component response regulator
MRKLFAFTIFIATFSPIYAINIDSMKTEIKKASADARPSLLCNFSTQLIQAGKLKDAQNFSEEALSLTQNTSNQLVNALALENLGLICQAKNDYTNAIKYLLDALRLRDNLKEHKAIAATKNKIGKVFLQQQDYTSAIQQFAKSMEYWIAEKDQNGIAETSKLLGDTYAGMKVFGKAKDNYQKAMDIWMEQEQHQKAADIAGNLGVISSELADYDGAITYYQTSLDLNTTTNNLPQISKDLRALSKVHLQQGNNDEAAHFGKSAQGLCTELKDSIGIVESGVILAMVANGKGDKAEAQNILEQNANLLKITSLQKGKDLIFAQIAAAYREMGNNEKAYAFMLEYDKAKDGIVKLDQNKALLDLNARYESEFEAKQKQQQIELLELEKSNSQKTMGLLLALVLGAASVGFLLYRTNRQKKLDNQLLQAKNDEISQMNFTLDGKNNLLIEQQVKVQSMNEKLRYEMAERENVEKNSFDRDSFLVNISNQMRSPLNVISGLTHLLLDQSPQQSQVDHLRTMQFSANSLLVYINDILDFSKIETGKLNSETRPFETTKLLLEVKSRFSMPISNKGLTFNFHANEAIPSKLIGDSARFNQILTNLISYCMQQTQHGSISVKVEPIPTSGKGMSLEITVNDTSMGIPQYKMDELLRKFSYSSADATDATQSTFGLSIMKRLVELQNGTVEASSVEGMGNRFRIILPFKLTETKVINIQQQTYSFPGAKILVVEDNKINSMVVVKMLQKAYAKVTTAENGLIALEKVAVENFDLILMDIQMPEMDGYRATSEIRKMDNEIKKNVPIIALTASPYLTETEKAQLFGMNDYIGKPFSPDELLEKIGSFLIIKEQSAAM